MSRIVSVWLPRWPIQRFVTAQATNPRTVDPDNKPVNPERPFVLVMTGAGGSRLAALNAAAEQAGLMPDESLADARAKADGLQVRAIDEAADRAALRRLALWATRYTPTASPWLKHGADGFFLDIEGAAHLFGGEDKLMADLANRLDRFGLAARLATAATPGAAWALSRFHHSPLFALPSGQEAAALAALPVEALRLTPETSTALRRLGFKTIGALVEQPRAPFAARFNAELLRRLDQALGRVDEPLVPIVAPPVYHSLNYLLEPIVTAPAIIARAGRLMQNLVHVLVRDNVGARTLKLGLYRVDGAVETVEIGLTAPTRSAAHVERLIALKLETVTTTQEAGFGFEAIGLAVTHAEPMPARQIGFDVADFGAGTTAGDSDERCAALIDALQQRLGANAVRRFEAVPRHLPERAEQLVPIGGAMPEGIPETAAWPPPEDDGAPPRPLLLLPRAEPTEVTALIPDGPPWRFSWRGVTYDVAGAQGPERIAAEWWRRRYGETEPTRDYYLVEDFGGRRFWLCREGLYGRETTTARWFVHGLFA